MEQDGRTEKQRMLDGDLYLGSDPTLVAERQRAYRLLQTYNQMAIDDTEQQTQLLRDLFARVGANPQIVPPFHCDYGSQIYVGDRFYMNVGCVILDCNTVHIGDDVLCAPHVQIYTAYHPTNPAVRLAGREYAAPIRIGNNVWIGGGAIICPGVTIGDNTTIGAGSVVTKDIPANVVAVGNPCRVLRSV